MPKQGVKTYMARRMKEWEQRRREKNVKCQEEESKEIEKEGGD